MDKKLIFLFRRHEGSCILILHIYNIGEKYEGRKKIKKNNFFLYLIVLKIYERKLNIIKIS